MVQMIVGEKGKGKTKVLLDLVNNDIKATKGSQVYLDKSTKHMYELNNKVRLITINEYPIKNESEFIGFIFGILSQDHDIEKIYVDSFLKIACVSDNNITNILQRCDDISNSFKVEIILSISLKKEQIPMEYQQNITISI